MHAARLSALRLLVTGCVSVVALAWVPVEAGAARSEVPLSIWYFKTPQPLTLDPTRLALLPEAGLALSDPSAALAAAVPGGAEVEAFTAPGWHLASLAQPLHDRAALLDAADAIGSLGAFVTPVFLDEYGEPMFPTPHILVQFADGRDVAATRAELVAEGVDVAAVEPFGGLVGAFRVETVYRNGVDVLLAAERLAQREDVLFAEPDMIATGRFHLIPNDPQFGNLWGLHNTAQFGGTADMDMDAPEAWDITLGSSAVRVLILDGGVQQDHPDINQVAGFDATGQGGGGGPVNACDNHGTAVAGCVSAIINNALGVVGVAPGVKSASGRMAISNLACDGTFTYQSSWHVNAISWGESIGARVSNSSFQTTSSSAVTTKYQTSRAAGMVHFVAAGNSGSTTLPYPANLSTVQAVAALTQSGTRAAFSNYGSGLDLSAPGVDIRTTDRTGSAGYEGGDYTWVQGTSFAAPYAAGVAALVISQFPGFTAVQVEEAVQRTCVDLGAAGYDTDFGYGFVNARNAADYRTTAPDAFSLVSPLDGAGPLSRNPSFSWTPAAGVVTYTVTLDTTPAFNSSAKRVAANISDTSYTLAGNPLADATLYYWKVDAINFYGTRTSTPAFRTFMTITDCNNDFIHDPNQIAANPALDCNGNGRLDSCDVSQGFSPDCNGNGRPDECDLADCTEPACRDCNNNGVLDGCDLAVGTSADCNFNGVPDECDRDACSGQPWCSDCNNNGIIDACDLATDHTFTSPTFTPMGTGFNATYTLVAPPDAFDPVTFTFTAVGDLNSASETVTAFVNGVQLGVLWVEGGVDCIEIMATLAMPASAFNASKAGAGGDVVVLMVPSPQVAPFPPACPNSSRISVRLDYIGQGASSDVNGNGVPDECEGPAGCPGDVNCDGAVTFDDIDFFVAALSGEQAWIDLYVAVYGGAPTCPYGNADCNGDSGVTFDDIDAFVALIGTSCP